MSTAVSVTHDTWASSETVVRGICIFVTLGMFVA